MQSHPGDTSEGLSLPVPVLVDFLGGMDSAIESKVQMSLCPRMIRHQIVHNFIE